jgi:intracellular septation protein
MSNAASGETAKRKHPEWLQPLLELGPLLVFFGVYMRADIFWATGIFMVVMAISVAISWYVRRELPIMPLFVLAFILVFGALTLWLQNETFIMMRPTISNVMFALLLWTGLFFGKPLLKFAFGSFFRMTEEGWRICTLRWSFFFLFLAILNEIVWRNFSTDFWVAFKVFGNMPLTFLFAAMQLPLLTRYALEDEDQVRGNANR